MWRGDDGGVTVGIQPTPGVAGVDCIKCRGPYRTRASGRKVKTLPWSYPPTKPRRVRLKHFKRIPRCSLMEASIRLKFDIDFRTLIKKYRVSIRCSVFVLINLGDIFSNLLMRD